MWKDPKVAEATMEQQELTEKTGGETKRWVASPGYVMASPPTRLKLPGHLQLHVFE